jgi:endonuclease/exonuclease/phosphatase (EEP) superfamily protein YafD
MKAIMMMLALSLTSTAFAIYDPTQFRNVPDDQVIEQLNNSGRTAIRKNMSILVWNVKKGTGENAWVRDLNKLTQGKAITIMQEGLQDEKMPGILAGVPSYGWTMAKTFYMLVDKNATGVITGAIQDPSSSMFLRSPDMEPAINTPKITLLTSYAMEDGSKIMVANIHAINVQTFEPFQRQIDGLIAELAKFEGNIILAGDFNTWIPQRTDYLLAKTKEIGLEQVIFANDPRNPMHTLDHIFVRGCAVSNAKVWDKIKSSDHEPLTADLACQ